MPFCPCLKVILFTWRITPLFSFFWILLVNKNTTLFLPIQYVLFIRHCACRLACAAQFIPLGKGKHRQGRSYHPFGSLTQPPCLERCYTQEVSEWVTWCLLPRSSENRGFSEIPVVLYISPLVWCEQSSTSA